MIVPTLLTRMYLHTQIVAEAVNHTSGRASDVFADIPSELKSVPGRE